MAILIFAAGAAVGLVCGGLTFVYALRKYMIANLEIDGSFEDVEQAIKKVVPQFEGWSFPIPQWGFYKSQLSKNLNYDNITNMVMHFVCKPSHANTMLRTYPDMGGIMPCTWAVYQTADGKVHIAKMNIGLMSKMYSGTVKNIMTDVATTEKQMVERIRETVKNHKEL